MQINIFYAHTYFQFSICKNVDVASKKNNFNCQIFTNADWTKLGENSFASNSFTV